MRNLSRAQSDPASCRYFLNRIGVSRNPHLRNSCLDPPAAPASSPLLHLHPSQILIDFTENKAGGIPISEPFEQFLLLF